MALKLIKKLSRKELVAQVTELTLKVSELKHDLALASKENKDNNKALFDVQRIVDATLINICNKYGNNGKIIIEKPAIDKLKGYSIHAKEYGKDKAKLEIKVFKADDVPSNENTEQADKEPKNE